MIENDIENIENIKMIDVNAVNIFISKVLKLNNYSRNFLISFVIVTRKNVLKANRIVFHYKINYVWTKEV